MKDTNNVIDYKILPLESSSSLLTDTQNQFLDVYFEDRNNYRLINKAEINPMELIPFLPTIWLADLITDENDNLQDVHVRLFGTELERYYGNLTGQNVLTDQSENSYKQRMPNSHVRLSDLSNKFFKEKKPLLSFVTYFEKGKEYLNVRGIWLPVSSNGDQMDMIFGYIEINMKSKSSFPIEM